MENENKSKKVLEIILIILVGLSFILIPLLNQHRNDCISMNNSLLVKRQNDRNGTIDITEYNYSDVKTISGTFNDFGDYTLSISQSVIDNNLSISGSNDVFGFGFNNYFRFSPIIYGNNIVALEYYIEFEGNFTKSYRLNYYYQPIIENDGEADYMRFTPVRRNEFIALNVLPKYDILNFSYYKYSNFNTFFDFVNNNEFASKLFNIELNYRYPLNYLDNVVNNTLLHFINIGYDYVSPLIQTAFNDGKDDGFNEGYYKGFNEGSSSESVFGMLKHAANSLLDLLNTEVLPNISLWLLISIPLSISIMLIMFKLLRGGN